ncbi:hypothetical protein DL96DRAFT_1773976 [Flagelloscypha sp. PMI_526]|nr:hypothetical protein DL96DRAFT_1773976 [Flagelloscypha sp. PMI_526]
MLARFHDFSPATIPPAGDLLPSCANACGVNPDVSLRRSRLSNFRRLVLLAVFCSAQFSDVFNISSLLAAIPSLDVALHTNLSEPTWVVSKFTFSAVQCEVSICNWHYCSLGTIPRNGFMNNKIALFALSGIGSMSTPSSLTLIVRIFHEPSEQGRAISVFGSTRAFGSSFLIGAIFTQCASWRWVFWFATILALPATSIDAMTRPEQTASGSEQSIATRVKHMDLPGVAPPTVAIILFILALTESTTSG